MIKNENLLESNKMQTKMCKLDKYFLAHQTVNNSARRIFGHCLQYQNARILLRATQLSITYYHLTDLTTQPTDQHLHTKRIFDWTLYVFEFAVCDGRRHGIQIVYREKKINKKRRRSEENTNRPKHVSSERNFFSVIFLVETISGTAANTVCIQIKSE